MANELGPKSTEEMIRQAREQAKQPTTPAATADLLDRLANRLESAQQLLAERPRDSAEAT